MAKLHELLAVDTAVSGQATKTRQELTGTFTNKRHLFQEKRVTFHPDAENGKTETREQSDIQTSVASELEWISDKLVKAMDVGHQIDIANTMAKADVVLEDGTTILKDVPATSLLQLEKHLKDVHDLISVVPTLDPAKGFRPDPNRKNTFAAREVEKTSTQKVKKVITIAPATDKHPAQAQAYDADERVGIIREQEWSSLITPATKADLLDKCEELQRAVKKARARANDLELDVTAHRVGKKLLDHILNPLLGNKS